MFSKYLVFLGIFITLFSLKNSEIENVIDRGGRNKIIVG